MKWLKNIVKKFIPWLFRNNRINDLCHLANDAYVNNKKHRGHYYCYKLYKKYNIEISGSTVVGDNLTIPHPLGIVIGEGVVIGNNVTIYQNVTLGRRDKDIPEYPVIEDDVTIYCNSAILGNVKVGKGAVIGAGSIVFRNVAPGEKVHGVVK